MQWNNLYLIPIVLVGGLLAFGAGRTIVARVLAFFGRLMGGAANKVAATVPVASPDAVPTPAPYSEPPAPLLSVRPSLAQRKEELAQAFLGNDDEWDQLATKLKAADEEEARRIALMDMARKRSRSNNVLVGKLDVPGTGGPLTTAIQVNEELLKTLKAAQASRDSAPKS